MSNILLNFLPMREYYVDGELKGCSRDGSFIPYIAEELIARSASGITIESGYVCFKETIPDALKENIKWVSREPYYKKLRAYLAPIYEELYFCHSSPNYKEKENLSDEERYACSFISYLESFFPEYLMAIDKGLQVDIDIKVIIFNLNKIRQWLKNPEGRKRFASLEGILNTYVEVECPALLYISNANKPIVELFRRLVSDAVYQDLSKHCEDLGFVEKVSRNLELMRRCVFDIVQSRYYGKVFNHAARTISIANSIYIPETSAADELFGSSYLPPILSLKEANKAALALWEAQSPEYIPMDRDALRGVIPGPAREFDVRILMDQWNSRNKNGT